MSSTQRNTTGAPTDPPRSMLSRVLAVLEAFGDGDARLSLAELSRRAGLPKATVHRITGEMCDERLLTRQPDGTYRLGLRLFEIGERVPQYRTLSDVALPIMEDLREATRQRIHLAVLDGVDVVYVEILGPMLPGVPSRTGGRLPAHASGVGKAILAYSPRAVVKARLDAGLDPVARGTITTASALARDLQRIRSQGTAYDREEAAMGVSCVAAPVFGADHKVRAALSITGLTRSIDPKVHGVAVRTAAFTLGRELREAGV